MRTILTIIAMMFVLSLIYHFLVGCSKTVKNVLEVHDTIYREKIVRDSTYEHIAKTDTVYKVKTDTIHDFHVLKDSILIRDSVFVREKGESIYIYKEKWRTKIDLKHDTIYRSKTDTVYTLITDTLIVYKNIFNADSAHHSIDNNKVVVKEKKSWNWLSWVGLTCIIGCLTFLGILAYKYYKGK